MKNSVLKKIALSGILAAFGILAFMIENLFPPLVIPGARMGISNIFILLAIILLGVKYGYAVLIIKVVLGSLLSGGVAGILYSLPAGLISCTVEILLIYLTQKFSVVAISVFSAVINITLQNITFCLITKNMGYVAYLPYLSLIAIIGGTVVGFATYLIIKTLPKTFFSENIKEEKN